MAKRGTFSGRGESLFAWCIQQGGHKPGKLGELSENLCNLGKIARNKIDVVSGLQKWAKLHLQPGLHPSSCWCNLHYSARLPLLQFFVCCNNLSRSRFGALEKPGRLGDFFSDSVATLSW